MEEERIGVAYEKNIIIVYDCKTKRFTYPVRALQEVTGVVFDDRPMWEIMKTSGFSTPDAAEKSRLLIEKFASDTKPNVYICEYYIHVTPTQGRWFRVSFICSNPGERVEIIYTDVNDEIEFNSHLSYIAKYDELTGLMTRNEFNRVAYALILNDISGIKNKEYVLVYFDILKFKAINDIYGTDEGDKLLKYIGSVLKEFVKEDDREASGRLDSDRFVMFLHRNGSELEEVLNKITDKLKKYELSVNVICNFGVYVIESDEISVSTMADRAHLAQSVIKGKYDRIFNIYTEDIRKEMLSEQEISSEMQNALDKGEFVVYYQPQYNHSTHTLVGAESLVRWNHPEKGIILPSQFIHLFEKNGFITSLDFYVFEQGCKFLKSCIERKIPIIPISSNFSRHDIFMTDFVERLEAIRLKYDLDVKYLRIEVTESVLVGGNEIVNRVIQSLHAKGYLVEMDDFGSGYSSLNVLKDIDMDIIKMDMQFMSEDTESNKGGTIISNIIRMARWLKVPVIAEGVENLRQADFLKSVGCEYIQGFFYSRPISEDRFIELLKLSTVSDTIEESKLKSEISIFDFWNPKSLDTLIFNTYVGAACVFQIKEHKAEVLRVNQKYLKELGTGVTEKDILSSDPSDSMDSDNIDIYLEAIGKAIKTKEEVELETWRHSYSDCCGDERICIKSSIRMIGHTSDTHLFYAQIRNVTAEKNRFFAILANEKRFKMASEQINIYYWEYIVSTKEMRPCFRCMRDLGLPPLVKNYPEPAIQMGIIPEDYADLYRDWHHQIEQGVKHLEAVIPLTVGRVPFKVRYTTEFDESGRPVKAYGSAALINE